LSIKQEIEKYMTAMDAPTNGVLKARFTFPAEFVGFQGHFPDEKVLPGVCQIQCVVSMYNKAGTAFLLKEIISAKFFSPVLPSEEILCVCSRTEDKPEVFVVKASVSRGGQVVSELKLRGLMQEKKI
jgi:3-hydroxyacyl-[acyl-carrier-protein] dehydratase